MKDERYRVKGIVAHGGTAGFGVARTIRSLFQHRYREKYKLRYKRARLFFLIDGCVLAVLAGLVGFNLYILTAERPEVSDIQLSLLAPTIETARPIALEAKMRVKGERAHENVVLFWSLPEGAEILQATPPIEADGRVNIGRIEPGEELSAKVVIRLFTDEPSVPFGFRIHEETGSFAGGITKPVLGSGLSIKPFIEATSIVEGASIPYLLTNDTPLDLEDVSIRATGQGRIQGADRFHIDKLPSLARALILFHPGDASDGFELSAEDTPLYRVLPEIETRANSVWRDLDLDLAPSTGSSTRIEIHTPELIELLVYHPGLPTEDHVQRISADVNTETISIAVDRFLVEDERDWFVLPLLTRDGETQIGPMHVGTITTNFDADVQARFYAQSGDQLGVGSLPPVVGEETTFWIFPELEPITADIEQFRLEMRLADGIELTGKQALPFGGQLVRQGDRVIWSSPLLSRSTAPVHAAFEVRVTPTEEMRGEFISFIENWTAGATEIRSDEALQDNGGSVDSSFSHDNRAKERGGRVR